MTETIPKTKKECFAQLDEMLSEETSKPLLRKIWMNCISLSAYG